MRRVFAFILLILIVAFVSYYYFYLPKHQIKDEIILYGNVDVRQVDLGFRANGRVISMPFQEGDFVKAGTLMAELDENRLGVGKVGLADQLFPRPMQMIE